MRNFLVAILFLIAIIAFNGCGGEGGNSVSTGKITGYVTNSQNEFIANATVNLYNFGQNTIVQTTKTDAKGYFYFFNVAPAQYDLEAIYNDSSVKTSLTVIKGSTTNIPNEETQIGVEKGSCLVTVTQNGDPYVSATVKIKKNGATNYLTQAVTNASGQVTFSNIAIGNYSLAVNEKENVKSITIVKDTTVNADIALTSSNTEYTILCYMVSDSALDSYLINNLNEMQKVGSTDKVNMIVQCKQSQTSGDPYVYRGKMIKSSSSNPKSNLSKIDTVSMASYTTLKDFIAWGEKTYPADKYILILWDHGDGWDEYYDTRVDRSICHDGNQSLKIIDIPKALSGYHFEALLFDACLMQMAEVLYEVKDYANYSLASEEETPASGFDYENLLNNLNNSSDLQTALTNTAKYLAETRWGNYDINVSLTNLNKLDKVATSIDDISKFLIKTKDTYTNNYQVARNNALTFHYCKKDFYDYATLIKNSINDVEYDTLYTTLTSNLNDAIVYNYNSSGRDNGLSINIPTATVYASDFNKTGGKYTDLAISKDTNWDDWLSQIK